MNYDELRKAAIHFYEQGAYAEALALTDREAPNFPDHAQALLYWRICLSALTGQPELSVGLFREALAQGFWFSAHLLKTDPDLITVRDLPEFERLLAISEERSAAARAAAVPSRLTFAPESGTGPAPLMIAMHGNNESAQAAVGPWRPLSALGWMVALPQSTQLEAPDAAVWNDQAWATAEVERHAGELMADPGVDLSRVVLGGFSMGGGLAIWMALAGKVGARGFVVMGPWLPDTAGLRPLLEAGVPAELRGYIIVGDRDEHCHVVSLAVRDLLVEFGVPCEVEVHEGLAHNYPPDFDRSLERATRFILGA